MGGRRAGGREVRPLCRVHEGWPRGGARENDMGGAGPGERAADPRAEGCAGAVFVRGGRMDKKERGDRTKFSRKGVLTTHPHLAEFLPFLEVLNAESARGVVLVAASYLENVLLDVLRSFLIEGKPQEQILSGFNAPIGSLSAKIALSASLGLINERERKECDTIRKIRNNFAHNVHPSFDEENVKSLCDNLTYRARPFEGIDIDARGSFTSASVALILTLTNRAHYVKLKRLAEVSWPY